MPEETKLSTEALSSWPFQSFKDIQHLKSDSYSRGKPGDLTGRAFMKTDPRSSEHRLSLECVDDKYCVVFEGICSFI